MQDILNKAREAAESSAFGSALAGMLPLAEKGLAGAQRVLG
jgi:hypothetical protein